MDSSPQPELVASMVQFLAKVALYDQHPHPAALTLTMCFDQKEVPFRLSARAVEALARVLESYADPEDCGACTGCGAPLDRDMRCQRCGRVDGIFGQTLARYITEAQHH
jgi:hypothetical protein